MIKPGVPLVAGALPKEAVNLFNDLARERRAPAYFLGQDYRIFLKNAGLFDYTGVKENFEMLSVALRGRHQRSNAAVALVSLETARETFPVSEEVLREGLRTVKWPGRFEIMLESPTVILDGAHNGEGVKALVEAVQEYYGARKVKLLFASMEDKDGRLMLGLLDGGANEEATARVGRGGGAESQRQ